MFILKLIDNKTGEKKKEKERKKNLAEQENYSNIATVIAITPSLRRFIFSINVRKKSEKHRSTKISIDE